MGIDIEEYKLLLPDNWHNTGPNRIHNRKFADFEQDWNRVWEDFLDKNPKAGFKDVNHQLNKMMRDFGLK